MVVICLMLVVWLGAAFALNSRWEQSWLAVGLVGLVAIATPLLTRPQTPVFLASLV